MRYALLRDFSSPDTVNFPDFQEFENSILEDSEVEEILPNKVWAFASSVLFRFMRVSGKAAGMKPPFDLRIGKQKCIRVAILCGPAFRRCTDFLRSGPKAAYLYDACEPWFSTHEITRFIEDTGIKVLFVTHPDFVRHLDPIIPNCKVVFIPEAVQPETYFPDLDKSLDILAYGRTFPKHHDALVKGLPKQVSYTYHYLQTRMDLLKALGHAKITINFPRSWIDPRLKTEMATMRYFQAMASKSLILGHCPDLLLEVMGYNPCIKADLSDPVGQVMHLLENYDEHVALIERNYQEVKSAHTFSHRWMKMKESLSNHNF